MNNSSNKYWNDYWSQGHKTSFGTAFVSGYEGVIKDVWQKYFRSLKSDSRVLDLCTGNASLLRLANESLNDTNAIQFTGVDYAQIDAKDNFAEQSAITLKFGVNIEKLPFEDNSFDYVISNFGIEYSELSKSIPEAARVLTSGGEIELVCHSHDSTLIKSNGQELTMLSQMLSSNDVIDNLQGLVVALAQRDANCQKLTSEQQNNFIEASKQAEICRHQLNDSIGNVANTYSKAFQESDFLGFLKYLLSAKISDKQQVLNSFKLDMINHKARLSAMITSALTNEQLSMVDALFEANGLSKINVKNVSDEVGKIALRLSAVKK